MDDGEEEKFQELCRSLSYLWLQVVEVQSLVVIEINELPNSLVRFLFYLIGKESLANRVFLINDTLRGILTLTRQDKYYLST